MTYCDLAARAIIGGIGQGHVAAGIAAGESEELPDTTSHVEAASAETHASA